MSDLDTIAELKADWVVSLKQEKKLEWKLYEPGKPLKIPERTLNIFRSAEERLNNDCEIILRMPESISLEIVSSQTADTDGSDEEEEEDLKWESESEYSDTSTSSDEDQAATSATFANL